MGKTCLSVLVAACLIAVIGCKIPSKAGEGGIVTGGTEGPEPTKGRPKELGKPKVPVPTEIAACRELVKSLNAPLITAVRVATSKSSGTPVETEEVRQGERIFYRVLIQQPTGKLKVVHVDQQMLEADQLVEPSSMTECKAIHDTNEQKIITAIRLAQKHFPGRLAKALFGKFEDRFLYTVTVLDAEGNSRLVRVDAEAMKVINSELAH